MKACTKCKVVKSLEDFGPCKLTKDKRQSWCRKCKYTHDRERLANNLELQAKKKAYWGSEAGKLAKKQYRATDHWKDVKRAQRLREKCDVAARRNYRAFYKLKSQHRVPEWVKPKDLLPFYRLAHALGPGYTIDHIIPLRSKLVCGLHTPDNIQVMTLAGNELKGVSLYEGWWTAGVRP